MEDPQHATILLVEDEVIIAKATVLKLKRFGYSVMTAHSGEDAVQIATENDAIDLILMDIDLGGGIDGPEAAQQILAHRHIPIVFHTSHMEEEYVNRVKAITRYGYIVKNSGDFVLKSSIEMAFELFAAHQKTLDREALLKETGRMAKVGGWELDARTQAVTWSEETYRIHEVPLDHKPPLENALSFYPPDDRDRLTRAIQMALNDGTPYDLELRFTTAGGNDLWVRTICKPQIIDGEVVKLKGTFQDITDLKQAYEKIQNQAEEIEVQNEELRAANEELLATNEKLREKEAILQAAMDQSHAGIAIADAPDGKLRYVNNAGLLIRGGARQEIVDDIGIEQYVASWHILHLDGTPYQPEEVPLARAVLHGETCREEFIIRRDDSEDRYVLAHATPIRDAKGRVSAGIVVFLDITERKSMEKELQDRNRYIEQLNNTLADAIFTVKLPEREIDYVNDAILRIFGYHSEECIGQQTAMFYPDEAGYLDFGRKLEKTIKSGSKVLRTEQPLARKNGEIFPAEIATTFLRDDTEQIVKVISIIRDITRRKKTEEALKENEERLSTLINTSPFPVAVADTADEQILYWSESAKKLFGHTPRTVSEWYALAYPDPHYRQQVIDRWKPFLEIAQQSKTAVNTGEYRIVCQDGSVKICELYANFIQDSLVVTFNDITERKHDEETIQRKEDKFQSLFNRVNDAIFIYDPDTFEILEANEATARLYGYDMDELIGMSCLKFSAEVDKSKEASKKAEEKGEERVKYRHHRTKDGHDLYVELIVYKAYEENEQMVFVVINDVTEYKKTEDALKAEQEKLRAITNSSFDIIHIMAKDGEILYENKATWRLLGYQAGERVGQNAFDFVHPDDVARISEQFADLVTTPGASKLAQFKLKHEDGSWVWFESNGQNFLNSPEINGILVNSRDITERKKAEIALKESERKFKEIFNSTSEAIVIHDDHTGKIIECNEVAIEMYGYASKDEMLSRTINDFSAEDKGFDQQKITTHLAEAVKNGTHTFEWLARKKNGDHFWIEVSLKRTSIGGDRMILAVVRDITERKKTEDDLRRSEEKYRVLFENMIDEVHLWEVIRDDNGTIQNWRLVDTNPAALSAWGKTRAETIGKTTDEIWPDANSIKLFLPIVNMIFEEEGRPYTWETYFEGTDQILRMTSFALGDYFYSTGMDITERKKAEQALFEEEILTRAVIDHSPIGISIRGRTGTLLMANDAWQKIWQISDNDIEQDKVPKEKLTFNKRDKYLQEHYAKVREVYETGGVYYIPEIKLLEPRKDKAEWISQLFFSISDKDGQVEKVVVFTQNITEQKQAEKRLQNSLKDLKLAQDIANVGNWSLDPETRIPVWSDQVYKIFNRDPKLGPPRVDELKNIYEEGHFPIVSTAIQQAIDEGKPYDVIFK